MKVTDFRKTAALADISLYLVTNLAKNLQINPYNLSLVSGRMTDGEGKWGG